MIFLIFLIIIIVLLILLYKNKKYFFITISIFISIFVVYEGAVFINHKVVKKYTIEEITNVDFDNISYVKIGINNNSNSEKDNYDVNKFRSEFENKQFKKELYLDEKLESFVFSQAVDVNYICYDKMNNVLCTVTQLGSGGGKYNIIKGKTTVDNYKKEIYYLIED